MNTLRSRGLDVLSTTDLDRRDNHRLGEGPGVGTATLCEMSRIGFAPSADGRQAPLLLDGAMATELYRRGLPLGVAPERWVIERPEAVVEVHRAYIEAGAGMVLTNTFGGTRSRLAAHGLGDRVVEVNRAATTLARRAVEGASPNRPVAVAGSMGPTGERFQLSGSTTTRSQEAAFAEQAGALAAGGCDALWVETMSELEEIEAAVAGARSVCDLPVAVTLSFGRSGRTAAGWGGGDVVERLAPLGLAAVGANCGDDLAGTEAAVTEMVAADPTLPIIVKSNAGLPERCGERLIHGSTPAIMAAHASRMRRLGARLIGGCCGTSPEHLAAMGHALGSDRARVGDHR